MVGDVPTMSLTFVKPLEIHRFDAYSLKAGRRTSAEVMPAFVFPETLLCAGR